MKSDKETERKQKIAAQILHSLVSFANDPNSDVTQEKVDLLFEELRKTVN